MFFSRQLKHVRHAVGPVRGAAPNAALRRALEHSFSLVFATIAFVTLAGCNEQPEIAKGRGTASVRESATAKASESDDFGESLPADASYSNRVVSLNPTATELLFTIGAADKLVGRSAWDEYPKAVKSIPSAGDGIRPNVEAVLALKPTLVILYGAAENRTAAQAFAKAGVKTMSIRVDGISQFMKFTEQLGVAVGMEQQARNVRDSVSNTLDKVRLATRNVKPVRAVWPVWHSPVMVIGHGSYLDELMEIAGGKNIFSDLESPSPQVSIEEIARRNPDVIIAGMDAQQRMRSAPAWRSVAAVREGRWITDRPSITGRPSVVLGMAAVMLARELHPELGSSLPPV